MKFTKQNVTCINYNYFIDVVDCISIELLLYYRRKFGTLS